MTTTVLFMCPHGAGKSLLAATYFREAARRSGLDASASTAGTDPDEVNMPSVVAAIKAEGLSIEWTPRLVTPDIAAAAYLLVSLGCATEDIPSEGPVTQWPVPQLSEDFDGTVAAIRARSEALAAQMLERAHKGSQD